MGDKWLMGGLWAERKLPISLHGFLFVFNAWFHQKKIRSSTKKFMKIHFGPLLGLQIYNFKRGLLFLIQAQKNQHKKLLLVKLWDALQGWTTSGFCSWQNKTYLKGGLSGWYFFKTAQGSAWQVSLFELKFNWHSFKTGACKEINLFSMRQN